MMGSSKPYALAILLSLCGLASFAQVPQGYEQLSKAEFRYFGLKLYDARLFTDQGNAFDWNNDFALEITYARRFTQNSLVRSTMDEIQRVGRKSPNTEVWNKCFRTVQKGHKYLATTQGADQIEFALNGKKTCSLKYPDIARSFMGIFLGQDTRSARFTQALRGE